MTLPNLTLCREQQREIREKTREWLRLASQLWQQPFDDIPVYFDLRGKTSGMYVVRGGAFGKDQRIRFNPSIFARHYEESCASTIPHEVAHHICYELHGRRVKPHGKEWRAIMQAFEVPAEATCKLDLSDIPQKRLRRFDYVCGCREHELTSIRHNRIQRGHSRYTCPKCQQLLVRLKKATMGSG